MKQSLKIMTVDDDVINLEILNKNLKDAGFNSISFEDGDVAWEYLMQHPADVDIVLLDKMMPNLNGMEVLSRMKKNENLRNIPVILQTGDMGVEQMREGLAAGAYYYLEKPFDPSIMISLVNAVIRDQLQKNDVRANIKQDQTLAHMLLDGRFRYKTLDEAKKLAAMLGQHAENPGEISIALSEIMINAVEHGNLGIGYEEKNVLMAENRLEAEINRRMTLPEYINKVVCVRFQREAGKSTITINDEGNGFEWRDFLQFDPMRLTDLNGRGIATASLMGLALEYRDNGSTVCCTYKLAGE